MCNVRRSMMLLDSRFVVILTDMYTAKDVVLILGRLLGHIRSQPQWRANLLYLSHRSFRLTRSHQVDQSLTTSLFNTDCIADNLLPCDCKTTMLVNLVRLLEQTRSSILQEYRACRAVTDTQQAIPHPHYDRPALS